MASIPSTSTVLRMLRRATLSSTRFLIRASASRVTPWMGSARHSNLSGKKFYSRTHVAYVDRGDIVVTQIEEGDSCEIKVQKGQQRAYCANSVLYFEICDVDNLPTYNVADHIALLEADKIEYPLTRRRWMDGDSFTPFGMNGSKKVSDYLIDAKVSMPEKSRQFVLLSAGEIAWLVGRRIDDRFRLKDSTERVLRLTKEII